MEKLIINAQKENIKKMDKNIEQIKASIDSIIEQKVSIKFKELMEKENRNYKMEDESEYKLCVRCKNYIKDTNRCKSFKEILNIHTMAKDICSDFEDITGC